MIIIIFFFLQKNKFCECINVNLNIANITVCLHAHRKDAISTGFKLDAYSKWKNLHSLNARWRLLETCCTKSLQAIAIT